jgi:SpoVK/Ycf46/Vps4 family AAA+-type ATPase
MSHRIDDLNVSAIDHNRCVTTMLSWIDGIQKNNNILIFATNNIKVLDTAFVDRMAIKIHFPHVTEENMKLFWKYHFDHFDDNDIMKLIKTDIISYREATDLIKSTVINKIINNDDTKISSDDIIKNKITVDYKKYIL